VTGGVNRYVDLIVVPGPGLPPIDADADPVTAALARPHRMLEPVDTRAAHRRPRPGERGFLLQIR
jgi:hypothetical protein